MLCLAVGVAVGLEISEETVCLVLAEEVKPCLYLMGDRYLSVAVIGVESAIIAKSTSSEAFVAVSVRTRKTSIDRYLLCPFAKHLLYICAVVIVSTLASPWKNSHVGFSSLLMIKLRLLCWSYP